MRNKLRAVLAAMIVMVGPAVTVGAEKTVSHFTIKGETVEATFQSMSPEDLCVEFFVKIVASDLVEETSPPKTKVAMPRTFLVMSATDICTDTVFFNGEGETNAHELRISGNLRSASLQTIVTVREVITGQIYNVDVDLTWTGKGTAVHENTKETFRDRDLGIFIKAQTKGVAVAAQAVGTVVAVGDNFTPEPSDNAKIERRDDSSLTIEKTK